MCGCEDEAEEEEGGVARHAFTAAAGGSNGFSVDACCRELNDANCEDEGSSFSHCRCICACAACCCNCNAERRSALVRWAAE